MWQYEGTRLSGLGLGLNVNDTNGSLVQIRPLRTLQKSPGEIASTMRYLLGIPGSSPRSQLLQPTGACCIAIIDQLLCSVSRQLVTCKKITDVALQALSHRQLGRVIRATTLAEHAGMRQMDLGQAGTVAYESQFVDLQPHSTPA